MEPIRVLIVDDHAITRQGLRTVLRVLPDMELAGEARNGQEAIATVKTLQPDVVLMDLVMPEMDGVTAITTLKQMLPDLPIIVLTTFSETDLVIGAVQGGADGYLLKDVEVEELARAIRTVKSGQPYLHPEATRHLLQATSRPPEHAPERLTKREQEVLTLLARGYTNRQIADSLTITEKTVSVHVSNLLNKLELTSRTQAALYATRVGLVAPEDAR
jgi:two-component system, NarL family, response regulator LiaR